VARVLFITGFNRSGTTLVTSAVTEAAQAATLTVGHLARHLDSVNEFLTAIRADGRTPDRGVDRLPITESTPEEYGWLLLRITGRSEFDEAAAGSGILQTVVREAAEASGADTVVLKNPGDIGRERLLLDAFPDARVILVRRRLGAIEDSLRRAFDRMAGSNDWIGALINPKYTQVVLDAITDPEQRAQEVAETIAINRRKALELAESVAELPPDRVAFLSYDELRDDPRAGAVWASHIVEPEALAKAVATMTFPEYNRAEPVDDEVREIDDAWERAWRRARERQVEAGILAGPSRDE
jgi:hypothetical protein